MTSSVRFARYGKTGQTRADTLLLSKPRALKYGVFDPIVGNPVTWSLEDEPYKVTTPTFHHDQVPSHTVYHAQLWERSARSSHRPVVHFFSVENTFSKTRCAGKTAPPALVFSFGKSKAQRDRSEQVCPPIID